MDFIRNKFYISQTWRLTMYLHWIAYDVEIWTLTAIQVWTYHVSQTMDFETKYSLPNHLILKKVFNLPISMDNKHI